MTDAIRDVEGPLLEVLDRAPFGVHRYELTSEDRLVFIGANSTANALLGVDHSRFIGKTIEEAFPALTATEIPTRYRAVALTRESWQIDQVAYDEQGIKGAFDVRAVPMGPRQMAVYFTDITERLRTEQSLRQAQAELNNYFTHAIDLMSIATVDGRFKRLNPEWERALGYPLSELEGTPFLDLVHPDDLTATVEVISGQSSEDKVQNFVNRYRCKDGSYRVLEWRSFPSEGALYAMARDVTERVSYEQRLEFAYRELSGKTKEMEELLYVTTHDLRSPLVNIQGFSERLDRAVSELSKWADGPAETDSLETRVRPILGKMRSALGYITGSAQKMDRLINALLTLSRLGRRPLQCANVDVGSLWKKVQTQFQHQLTEASVVLQTGELPPCYADSSQLEQVLCNLLDNAIKYRAPERAAVVTFQGELLPDGGVLYRLGDTGRGIEPGHWDRIWELFHRLAPKSDVPGEGIGLTAVRQIVTRHGGTIEVTSTPGVGTQFSIRLKGNVPNATPSSLGSAHGH